MPGQIRIASFTCNNSSPFNVTVSPSIATGQVPQGIVVVVSGSRSPTALDAVHSDAARMSVGAYDFTTYRACGTVHEGGALTAVANAAYRVDTATVVQLPTQTGPGLEIEATVTAVGIDSVELTFSSGSQFYGYVIFVYGTSAATIDVQSVSVNAATVDVSMSFLPDFILAFGVNQAFVADGSGDQGMMSAGFAGRLPSVTQACGVVCFEDRPATATSVANLTRNDSFLSTLTSSAGTVTEGTRLSATFPNATGYTVARSDSTTIEYLSVAISLGGVRAWCGTPSVASNSTGPKSITDPGFRPHFVMMVTQQVGTVNSVLNTQGQLCIGAARSSTEQACAAMRSRDNVATSETGALASAANIVSVVNGAPAWDWIADFTQMTATGFDINVSDASGAARVPAVLAVEQAFDHSADLVASQRRFRRRLQRM